MNTSMKTRVQSWSRKQKAVVAVGVTAVSLAAAGGAFALWTANGSGNGQAQALTAQSVTVTAATGTADLYPGYTAGKLYFTLTNPNPYPVVFNSMTAGAVTSGNTGACASALVTTAASKTGLALNVAANSTSAMLSIDADVTMNLTAGNGCQGVTFTIPLTLVGSQV